jgi:hypothetical protein
VCVSSLDNGFGFKLVQYSTEANVVVCVSITTLPTVTVACGTGASVDIISCADPFPHIFRFGARGKPPSEPFFSTILVIKSLIQFNIRVTAKNCADTIPACHAWLSKVRISPTRQRVSELNLTLFWGVITPQRSSLVVGNFRARRAL